MQAVRLPRPLTGLNSGILMGGEELHNNTTQIPSRRYLHLLLSKITIHYLLTIVRYQLPSHIATRGSHQDLLVLRC